MLFTLKLECKDGGKIFDKKSNLLLLLKKFIPILNKPKSKNGKLLLACFSGNYKIKRASKNTTGNFLNWNICKLDALRKSAL